MRSSNCKVILARACALIWLGLLLFLPVDAFCQAGSPASGKVLVGTAEAPPVYMKTADGRWEGFGIELWQAVAQRMGVSFEFREYSNLGGLLEALEKKEIDLIPCLPVAERYESAMDFSQSYLKTGLAIAVPPEGAESKWLSVAESLFSQDILEAVGLLIVMSVVSGAIVWLFERRRNAEMFGEGKGKGIGQGIWWSMVTMTTVGYGDKAPKTAGGRIVALIWMLVSIVFIASFTANITASLTVSQLRGKVRGFNDLYNARVGSLSRAEGAIYLARHGIAVIPFESNQEGLEAVAGKKIDAFVLNEIILKHLAKKEFPGRVQIVPGVFDEYFVSMALQDKSPLRKPINKALLKFMHSKDWAELRSRYVQ
ncbi:MAG: transporter substrate-binding domain-containing protein [Hyphomicrobiales bacterium]